MRTLYLFALFLVLYEFTAYSANDMIMPGMIQVVNHFNTSQSYVALSLSFYILGNCASLLIVGLLSEYYGKRKIIIIGNLLFFVFTVLIACSQNIGQFMFWRFLEGSGLSMIALGYALIHENFNDKNAVKLISLMANVSLLAPLLGPAIGSAIVSYLSWRYVFIITAAISAITLLGLYKYTPATVMQTSQPQINITDITKQYWQIIKNNKFLQGALCVIFAILPILFWISQAPNLIFYKLHQTYTDYVIYQIISVGGLSISSILMQFMAGKYRLYSLVTIGNMLILLGLLISLIGSKYIIVIVGGQCIYTLGVGFVNGCITRLLMKHKDFSPGMLATMFGFLQTFLLFIGITLTNKIFSYFDFSLLSFTVCSFVFGLITYFMIKSYISNYRERGWE